MCENNNSYNDTVAFERFIDLLCTLFEKYADCIDDKNEE